MFTTTRDQKMAAALAFAKKPAAQLFNYAYANMRDGICLHCHGAALRFKDAVSVREWTITGQCQRCQDGLNATQGARR